jgi:FkbM family methyltransferase
MYLISLLLIFIIIYIFISCYNKSKYRNNFNNIKIHNKYGKIKKILNPYLQKKNSYIYWATDLNNNFIKNNWPNTFDFDHLIKQNIIDNIKKIPHNHCIIDCGAHIGDLSIPVCDATKKFNRTDIIIYAIDPSYEKCEYIKYIAKINDYENLKVLHCGLSDKNKILCNEGNTVNDTNTGATIWSGNNKTNDCNKFYSINYLLCNNIIKQNIGLLHLDSEGSEYDILLGIIDYSSIIYISCEAHMNNDNEIERKNNITNFLLSKNFKNLERIQTNEIFIKK